MNVVATGFRYFEGDQFVLRTIASSAVLVQGTVSFVNDQGEDGQISLALTSASDRTVVNNTASRMAGGGTVIGAVVVAAGLKRGQLFASIRIGNPLLPNVRRQLICAGYIHDERALVMGIFENPQSGQGLKVDNESDTTLTNNTAATRTITVPTNARWKVYGGTVLNADDVTRATSVQADNGTDELVSWRDADLAASTRSSWPATTADDDNGPVPFILNEADRVTIIWAAGGASAGGAAKSSCVIEEWIEP